MLHKILAVPAGILVSARSLARNSDIHVTRCKFWAKRSPVVPLPGLITSLRISPPCVTLTRGLLKGLCWPQRSFSLTGPVSSPSLFSPFISSLALSSSLLLFLFFPSPPTLVSSPVSFMYVGGWKFNSSVDGYFWLLGVWVKGSSQTLRGLIRARVVLPASQRADTHPDAHTGGAWAEQQSPLGDEQRQAAIYLVCTRGNKQKQGEIRGATGPLAITALSFLTFFFTMHFPKSPNISSPRACCT